MNYLQLCVRQPTIKPCVFISGTVPAVVVYLPGQFYLLFMHPISSFWCNFGILIKFVYFLFSISKFLLLFFTYPEQFVLLFLYPEKFCLLFAMMFVSIFDLRLLIVPLVSSHFSSFFCLRIRNISWY